MIKLYTDAASKGNPGPTGLGVLVINNHHQYQVTGTLARADNHHGEFAAARLGFQYLLDHFGAQQTVLFYTDSRVLSDTIGKNYTKRYQTELTALNQLINQFTMVITRWIPDRQNHGAHHLANQALRAIE
ncbi:ribonuclease HI family protein [Limosilactobacillus sp.]|uniref:ribonuclease HI family protein n=1 Tax=Limosilactobacillus sp. TaxID=2773925 RepID=UPI00359F83C5